MKRILPDVIDFLDHFEESLDVVVGCARKTEIDRWERLFEVVGEPRGLFEMCLDGGKLRTAASYLLVLHNLEEGDGVKVGLILSIFSFCFSLLSLTHTFIRLGQRQGRAK